MSERQARYGWESNFSRFASSEARVIRESLASFVRDASPEQGKAWDHSIPPLQRETREILANSPTAQQYTAIMEYELPYESRRTDVILLVKGAVVVLELKGKLYPSQADIDQAAAYARDLRCYHQECHEHPVHAVVVPMRSKGFLGNDGDIAIMGPDALDDYVATLESCALPAEPVDPARFLSADAYRPLPTIIEAARELMRSGTIRAIHRARAATAPALQTIREIIHEAARTSTRRLILLTGVPGAGKTLVGLQTVHAHYLDDLAVTRAGGKPTAPAVFLSGNGPLVTVLQYELGRGDSGPGKAFVRGVFDYVKHYSGKRDCIPPQHVLVFDEAQRAFDAEQVQEKHKNTPGFTGGKSEPEHFIEFADRIPGWCVVMGLIGGGQEIHIGEEAGLVLWRQALEKSSRFDQWAVHLPGHVETIFSGSAIPTHRADALNLNTELRFHSARYLHVFVAGLLEGHPVSDSLALAKELDKQGYHLRITRSLEQAKGYLRERYSKDPDARFGVVASSKDKDLERFGVANDFQTTKRIKFGPWYADAENAEGGYSCRHLRECVTEFGAQGLELDAVLLAWGTDLAIAGEKWSIARARGYMKRGRVKSPYQLRINAYRVLLTRGRDASVVFVPPLPELDATFEYLTASGFRELTKVVEE